MNITGIRRSETRLRLPVESLRRVVGRMDAVVDAHGAINLDVRVLGEVRQNVADLRLLAVGLSVFGDAAATDAAARPNLNEASQFAAN